MGWLVRYSEERNYCLYSYLAHLDRVDTDPTYKFVFSELPHLITMMEFEPQRFEQFARRVKQGRVEVVNAFVLEPTINLSGGEALVQQGVQGLRWYKQIMNLQPRYCWMIDSVGWHEQMAQIVTGLELDAFVYCRYNPTVSASGKGHAIHWIQSPDGTRALAISPGHYFREFNKAFRTPVPLSAEQLQTEIASATNWIKHFPHGAPILLFGGARDYSLPPNYENYPAELIEAWNAQSPRLKIRMATLSDYMDSLLPHLRSGSYEIPVITSGSARYGYSSFSVNTPFYKQWYRRTEHRLQSAEAIATMASLRVKTEYPSQQFADSWLLMALNMDRNSLWGVGVDGTFYDDQSWDSRDRFEYVETVCEQANRRALTSLTQEAESSVFLFNPVNWTRKGPFEISLPEGRTLAEEDCQLLEDNRTTLTQAPLPSFSLSSMKLKPDEASSPTKTLLPENIETTYYSAKVDPNTGGLVSLKLKTSGREILAGPANVILAESGGKPHGVPLKPKRSLIATSSDHKPVVSVTQGSLATIVRMQSDFYAGPLRRVIRFYKDSPRIDFVTQTNNGPPGTVLSVQFPLAGQITHVRRGIPYGFSHAALARNDSSRIALPDQIIPVIRWSDYTLQAGGGAALLDRGLPARELIGNTPILLLHNVCDTYYNRKVTCMNHIGSQTYEYALLIHEQPWDQADVPQWAWEYNCSVLDMVGRAVSTAEPLLETSDNLIVQALRRDGTEIELRMAECLGEKAKARLKVNLPHKRAVLTNLLGRKRRLLDGHGEYNFDVRPQQIVTVRLTTNTAVPPVQALPTFDSLIPPAKRKYMRNSRNPQLLGHPPTQ